MSRLTYKVINALAAFGVCIGALFKIQHYPMASVLLIGGLVMQVIGYLITPAKYRSLNPFTVLRNPNAIVQIMHGMSLALIIIGVLFKIQHYPGAGVLMIVGWCTLAITLIAKVFLVASKAKHIDISNFGKDFDDE